MDGQTTDNNVYAYETKVGMPIGDWHERRKACYPRLPAKAASAEAISFVQRFFQGDNWKERTWHVCKPEFEDAFDTFVCNTPLDEIDISRIEACTNYRDNTAASRLLCLSLDNWVQTLAGTPLPHPDVDKYVDTVAAPFRNGFRIARCSLSPIESYLNTACRHEGIGEILAGTLPSLFMESHPTFEAVFLGGMLCRRSYDTGWKLNVDTRRCLCLCGYEVVKRLPLKELNATDTTPEVLISRAVFQIALEDCIFTFPEQVASFRAALTAYLVVENHQNLTLLLFPRTEYWNQRIKKDSDRDAAFRIVLLGCAHSLLDSWKLRLPDDIPEDAPRKIKWLVDWMERSPENFWA